MYGNSHIWQSLSLCDKIEKQRSRLAGWVQLSAEAVSGPDGVPPAPPCVHRGPVNENTVYAG